MKKLLVTMMMCLCSAILTSAQTKAPIAVENALRQHFPGATAIKWHKENAHEYEAEFLNEGKKMSANFTDKGVWIETETPVNFNELPASVKDAFINSHKNCKPKSASKIDLVDGTMKFEIEFISAKKTHEILYTNDGKEIK